MFEKGTKEYRTELKLNFFLSEPQLDLACQGFKDGAETTLRKVVKYFSTRVLDENCDGYFSQLSENEEKLQELSKELENV